MLPRALVAASVAEERGDGDVGKVHEAAAHELLAHVEAPNAPGPLRALEVLPLKHQGSCGGQDGEGGGSGDDGEEGGGSSGVGMA